jgi:hypothetical protein
MKKPSVTLTWCDLRFSLSSKARQCQDTKRGRSSFRCGPASRSQRVFDLQPGCGLRNPAIGPVGHSACDAFSDRLHLARRLGLIDVIQPPCRPRNRQWAENGLRHGRAIRAMPGTPVFPLLRTRAEIRPQGVPLHVSHHGQKVVVFFDRKRLESTLVQMAGPDGVVARMPPHRVGVGQPPEKTRDLMPVIGADHGGMSSALWWVLSRRAGFSTQQQRQLPDKLKTCRHGRGARIVPNTTGCVPFYSERGSTPTRTGSFCPSRR